MTNQNDSKNKLTRRGFLKATGGATATAEGLIGLGIMGCSGINRGAGELPSAGKMEKKASETRVTARPVNVVMPLKPIIRGPVYPVKIAMGVERPKLSRPLHRAEDGAVPIIL